MAPVPPLEISGTSLFAEAETTQEPRRVLPKPSKSERLNTRSRATPSVCGTHTAQRSQGRLQRRSWYHPARVPESQPSGHDRSTCPWRWKNLCETGEKGSSGSMCLANKLRPCAKLAKKDCGNLSKVASEATLGARGLLSKPEQDVLESGLSRPSLNRRPASAPCMRRGATHEVPAMTSQCIASAPQLARPRSAPSMGRSASTPSQRSTTKRPQSAGSQRNRSPSYGDWASLEALAEPVLNRPVKVLLSDNITVLKEDDDSIGASLSQCAQVSPSIPAHASALRVGTTLADHQKIRQYNDLRQWPRGQAFQEESRALEERLSLRVQGVPRGAPQDFETRLQALETRLLP